MAAAGTAIRSLRALRHAPPGHAGHGARRTLFQSSLEQCEQFLAAASDTGYATRPVQLFYALSQAGRAIVAASPQVGNQGWQVSGHGLTAGTSATLAADVTVTATRTGLFPAVASAIGAEALTPGEPAALRDLWPLLPETVPVPLSTDAMLPALLFFQDGWPEAVTFTEAAIDWLPRRVHDLYGQDIARVQQHLDLYPALRSSVLHRSPSAGRLDWRFEGPGAGLDVQWRDGTPPLTLAVTKTLDDLKVARYRSASDTLVTPAIGSMTSGLHPFLALWAVLLALSSLSRYQPATWSKMTDIDKSAEANPIEHLLEEAVRSVPAAVHYQLTAFS